MLARTPIETLRLTAEQLGIPQIEYDTLISVRDDLASGRIHHVDLDIQHGGCAVGFDRDSKLFNMQYVRFDHACGTAQCIGGHMWARLGFCGSIFGPFYHLFAPRISVNYLDLTTEQAVRAIDYWLQGETGQCWPMALADDGITP